MKKVFLILLFFIITNPVFALSPLDFLPKTWTQSAYETAIEQYPNKKDIEQIQYKIIIKQLQENRLRAADKTITKIFKDNNYNYDYDLLKLRYKIGVELIGKRGGSYDIQQLAKMSSDSFVHVLAADSFYLTGGPRGEENYLKLIKYYNNAIKFDKQDNTKYTSALYYQRASYKFYLGNYFYIHYEQAIYALNNDFRVAPNIYEQNKIRERMNKCQENMNTLPKEYYRAALADLEKAIKLQPNNPDVQKMIQEVKTKINKPYSRII